MEDHDQRFKELLREFFVEFMELFFPKYAAQLDVHSPEWLDKELFVDPPGGERRELDLVAKVRRIPAELGEEIVLIHVEIESGDSATSLDERFPEYYRALRRRYGSEVLPLAVFLKVGFEGLGVRVLEDTVLGEWVTRMRYWYIGLPELDGRQYLGSGNWLGVGLSPLMKAPPGGRAKLTADAQEKAVRCPQEARRYLLLECIQAYAPLTEQERLDLVSLLRTPEFAGAFAMNKTVREEGREEGERGLVRRILQRRFGVLNEPALRRLEQHPVDQLDELAIAAMNAQSLKDLGLED